MDLVRIATWADVPDRVPTAATVAGVDLVIVRRGDAQSVLYGRCLHRGAVAPRVRRARGTRVSELEDALAGAFANEGPR